MKQKAAGIMAIIAMSLFFASAVWAGQWKEDNGKYWYENDDGSRIWQNIWEYEGERYGFDDDGYMLTGWQNFSREKWYYFSPDSGKMVRGWLQQDGKWYYLDELDGHMYTGGPKNIDGKLYFFHWDTGQMRANEIFCACDGNPRPEEGRCFYQANPDGTLRCNDEDRNPQNPSELVRYDDKGRITAYNRVTNHYEQLICHKPEHDLKGIQKPEEEAGQPESQS